MSELTDERVSEITRKMRGYTDRYPFDWMPARLFDSWLAAVESSAARRTAGRIAEACRGKRFGGLDPYPPWYVNGYDAALADIAETPTEWSAR